MNMLISSGSFIFKESLSNIFNKIYKNIKLSIIDNIDNLKESNMYDVLFIHIANKGYEDLKKVIEYKSKYNKVIILDLSKDPNLLKMCINAKLDGYVTDFEDEQEIKYIIGKIINGNKFYDSDVVEMIGDKKQNLG